jgi:hydrophobic/amphiphilic exporter-1 (mainly G- bacteria), HAE1 family
MQLRVSAWSIRNPLPVAVLFIALVLVGWLSYTKLPIRQNPNIIYPAVTVGVTQSGASPSELENQVTRPVEDAVAAIPNVKHVSSGVSLGISNTTVEFELGTDLQKATDQVRTAIDRIRVQLPTGIDPPLVQRVDANSQSILIYAVSSKSLSPVQISWFIDNTVARALQGLPGVAQVNRDGGQDREINVTLNPQRMAAFGVTAPQVNAALYQYNVDETGGRADVGGREQTVRVLGQALSLDTLRKLTIPAAGRYVALSDIAEIGDGQSEPRAFAMLDGRPVVGFEVNETVDANELKTEARVKTALAKLEHDHPEVTLTQIIDTVDDTRLSYDATIHVLLEGMALAAVVVFFFLKNWRATAIAATAMPLSLIPTFSGLQLFGFNLDNISLLSLTLVIGILVDDAIVEIENIEKRIERGETPYRAALVGADSIGLAVVATTATIVVVFTPVSFMGGIVGEYFREFGLTVAMAVIFSLVVARLLTPLLAAYFLKRRAHSQPSKPLGGVYGATLNWAMRHRWIAAGLGGAIFIGSLVLLAGRPTGFSPIGDPGYLYINLEGPPGATRAEMVDNVKRTTRVLLAQPDTLRVYAQVGVGSGSSEGQDLNNGMFTVVLKPHRHLTTDQFKRSIRPLLRQLPDVRLALQGNGFGSADVETVLSSQNGPALEKAQLELMREMRALPELSDVRPSPMPAGPELEVRPKPDEAARLGVTSDALAQVLRIATIGDIDANVSKYSEGERRIPIRVRLPEADRGDLQTLGQLRVPTAGGGSTPLASVADLSFEAGPARLIRYGRERRVSVQADLNGVSLGTAIKAVNNLPVMKNLPADVHKPAFGDAEVLGEITGGFMTAILSGIGLIYAVLVLLFRSFFKPIIILAALPLSLAGAVAALTLTGLETDMPVFIGLLMLFGIAAKNSILLVEFAIEDERAGQSRWEALHNACRERARPIVMTTVAMVAGMLPTALGLGQGSEFRRPMAIAVIGGLISSTALSLVLVPVIYSFVDAVEAWLVPKFGRFITPKSPGDDAPIHEGEETLVTTGA